MATDSLITYEDSNVNQGGESSKNLTLPLLEIHALRLLYSKKRVEAAEIVSFLQGIWLTSGICKSWTNILCLVLIANYRNKIVNFTSFWDLKKKEKMY